MRILTFGSCLSRYVANEYVRLFGGEIRSCVYHNRSDAFVGRFIDRDWPEHPFDVVRALVGADTIDADADSKSDTILRNQYPAWIGRHRLSHGQPLVQGLAQREYDLIFIDNFMDVSARLAVNKAIGKGGVFLKSNTGQYYSDPSWILGDFLEPIQAVFSTKRIIAHFNNSCPDAKIVFMNFPWNTYESASDRTSRAKKFQELMSSDVAFIIPALTVPQMFQTKEAEHFKSQFYCAYAGIIYREINFDIF